MKLRTTVSLCICLFVSTTAFAQTEIPLEIGDGGNLFVKVTLNDGHSARFALDTGAGINVISSKLFRELRPSLKEVGQHTGVRHNGERLTGMLYRLPALSIGSLRKTDVVIGEYDGLNGFDGLLSMDYFRDTPFTINFAEGKLTIETERSLKSISGRASRIPIRLKKNGEYELSFFVTLCVNDTVQAEAEFDTGGTSAGHKAWGVSPRFEPATTIEPAKRATEPGS